MRLTAQELKNQYYPQWNDNKHDIVKVCYGDDPLIQWNRERYLEYSKEDNPFKNIEAIEAYIFTRYGDYSIYRPLIGGVYISDSTLHEVLCGDINIDHKWNITLNVMYGLTALNITKSYTQDVIGFRTKDGIRSSRLRSHTKEIDADVIERILNNPMNDYGESVQKFMETCRHVYSMYPQNYILEECSGDRVD